MSGPVARKFFGGRNAPNRNTFERVNPKYVPPSRHAIFIRGFANDVDTHKIRDYFQEASKSNCGVDFTSYNDEQRKLSIALRFESHDIAKEMLLKFNNTEIFGYRVEVTWFKDLKKARDRMLDERRVPFDEHRINFKNNRFEYERRDNREWSDARKKFPQNNNNKHSKSVERSDANSDASYGRKRKHSSEYEKSRSHSSNRSEKSYSESDSRSILINKIEGDIRSKSPSDREVKAKNDLVAALSDKPAAYTVDLDEIYSENVPQIKVVAVATTAQKEKSVSSIPDNYKVDNVTNHKHDSEDKKKKKKKRKRRRVEHSGSMDSFGESSKIAKYNPATDQNENAQFSAIAGDINNWKQTASDSDDFLTKNNQNIKSKPKIPVSASEKLNNEKSLKLLKMKIENIEKAYKKDSETYSSVISVLIRKSPELKVKLESMLKDILIDVGNQCMDSMRDYILHLSDNNQNHLEPSASPASSM